jgi:hypothetical protein
VSATVLALRQLLQHRFPDSAPLAERRNAVATGLGAVDAALPAGGLPRGRLTAWVSEGGATAVLRAACLTTVGAAERAVWIDAAGTAGPGWTEGPLLLRPAGPTSAFRSAEAVLHSGAFALVVLAGAEPEGTARVRLARAAREGGAAFVTLAGGASPRPGRGGLLAALHVTSRILPHSYRWRPGPFGDPADPIAATIELRTRGPGWARRAQVVLAVASCDVRLPLGAGLADRRGGSR